MSKPTALITKIDDRTFQFAKYKVIQVIENTPSSVVLKVVNYQRVISTIHVGIHVNRLDDCVDSCIVTSSHSRLSRNSADILGKTFDRIKAIITITGKRVECHLVFYKYHNNETVFQITSHESKSTSMLHSITVNVHESDEKSKIVATEKVAISSCLLWPNMKY
jgi:hypothetical protein